jgi:hypothetical protein
VDDNKQVELFNEITKLQLYIINKLQAKSFFNAGDVYYLEKAKSELIKNFEGASDDDRTTMFSVG